MAQDSRHLSRGFLADSVKGTLLTLGNCKNQAGATNPQTNQADAEEAMLLNAEMKFQSHAVNFPLVLRGSAVEASRRKLQWGSLSGERELRDPQEECGRV